MLGEVGGAESNMSHSSNFVQKNDTQSLHFSCVKGGLFPLSKSQEDCLPENELQSAGPIQFSMYSSQASVSPQIQNMHHLQMINSQENTGVSIQMSQSNVQYYPGTNYVTTVAIHPDQQIANQVPIHHMQTNQNFFLNSNSQILNAVDNFNQINIQQQNGMPGHLGRNAIGNQQVFYPKVNEDYFSSSDASMNKNVVNRRIEKKYVASRLKSRGRGRVQLGNPKDLLETEDYNEKNTANNNLRNCFFSNCVSNTRNCSNTNHQRASLRSDSVKSENTESSCGSFSSECSNVVEGNIAVSQENLYTNGQVTGIANLHNLNGTSNDDYQHFRHCQDQVNFSAGKPDMSYGIRVSSCPPGNSDVPQFHKMRQYQQHSNVAELSSMKHPAGTLPQIPAIHPGIILPKGSTNPSTSVVCGKKVMSDSYCNQSGAIPHISNMMQGSFPQHLSAETMMNPLTVVPNMRISQSTMIANIAVVPFGWKRFKNNLGQVVYVR